jgi:hypothetical protein
MMRRVESREDAKAEDGFKAEVKVRKRKRTVQRAESSQWDLRRACVSRMPAVTMAMATVSNADRDGGGGGGGWAPDREEADAATEDDAVMTDSDDAEDEAEMARVPDAGDGGGDSSSANCGSDPKLDTDLVTLPSR